MPHPKHHKWDNDATAYRASSESPDGNERTERTCERCGMTKITVHPPHGFPWHEWRPKGCTVAYVGEATPPCFVAKAEAVKLHGVEA